MCSCWGVLPTRRWLGNKKQPHDREAWAVHTKGYKPGM